MSYTLEVTVDTNDADYVTELFEFDISDLPLIEKICNKIEAFKPYKGKFDSDLTFSHRHNWPEGDCFREDLGEKSPQELYNLTEDEYWQFRDYLPSTEYGFHTIESIYYYPTSTRTKLL